RHRVARERRCELAHRVGGRRCVGPLMTEEDRGRPLDVVLSNLPLIEDLQRRFAGAVTRIFFRRAHPRTKTRTNHEATKTRRRKTCTFLFRDFVSSWLPFGSNYPFRDSV